MIHRREEVKLGEGGRARDEAREFGEGRDARELTGGGDGGEDNIRDSVVELATERRRRRELGHHFGADEGAR